MPVDNLIFNIDTPEPRVQDTIMSALFDGSQWDRTKGENVIIDNDSGVVMLLPMCMESSWGTTGTGAYRRLQLADYSNTSNKGEMFGFASHDIKCVGDTYIYPSAHKVGETTYTANTGCTVYTNETFEANKAFYISYFTYNPGNAKFIQFECGWKMYTEQDPTNGLGLRFWSDGNVEVWRNTVYIGNTTYKTREKTTQSVPTATSPGLPIQQSSNELIDIALIPGESELYIFTNCGSTLFAVPDLLKFTIEGTGTEIGVSFENSPVVVAEPGRFWWKIPATVSGMISCAPITFKTTGKIKTNIWEFKSAPITDIDPSLASYSSVPTTSTGCSVSVSVKEPDGTTDFVPNSIKTKIILEASLIGTGLYTPFLYGANAIYSPQILNTTNSTADLTPHLMSMKLQADENPETLKINIELNDTTHLEDQDTGHHRWWMTRVGNRPVEFSLDDIPLFKGRAKHPSYYSKFGTPSFERITLECASRWYALEKYIISDRFAFDGVPLVDAFKFLLTLPGYPVIDTEIEDIDFTIANLEGSNKEKFSCLVEEGETAAGMILKLRDDYIPNWIMGWRPYQGDYVFQIADPRTLNKIAPVITLYRTGTKIINEVPTPQGTAYTWVRSMKETITPPEANYYVVSWRNQLTGKNYRVLDIDYESVQADTHTSARPDNWIGEPWLFGYANPSRLGSLYDAARKARYLKMVGSKTQWECEFECEFLLTVDGDPVWIGDIVELDDKYWRITNIDANFKFEKDGERWRPTTYRALMIKELYPPSRPTPDE